jgi:polysaccharide deacetylase family protein (PEP-CTERM system associated)
LQSNREQGMSDLAIRAPHLAPAAAPGTVRGLQVVLSFDVEEHFRIEAAAGLRVSPSLCAEYLGRVTAATDWLLGQLDEWGARATFFVVGTVARDQTALVRAIHRAGHEVASHGWEHRRLHHHTAESFRADVRRSKDALEQLTGAPVVGYRAPTFSIVRQTAWAVDVLGELGLLYDSSVYPVWHDRYGVPGAPRWPFRARGREHTLLEIPPATLRLLGGTVPVGGGGYFRLLPLSLLEWALRQTARDGAPPVAMLYFHPWEFDPDQPRLPLRLPGRLRTYVGIRSTQPRLRVLLSRHRFVRAADVARQLLPGPALPCFDLAAP